MQYQERSGTPCARELGLKLANFRKKLAMAIGQKKITQGEFGEMYGGLSNRSIAAYELGDVVPSAALLYLLWLRGHSIDAIFSDGGIKEEGRFNAIQLFNNLVDDGIKSMNDLEIERALREASGDKKVQTSTIKETATETSGKSKAGDHKAGKTKKR